MLAQYLNVPDAGSKQNFINACNSVNGLSICEIAARNLYQYVANLDPTCQMMTSLYNGYVPGGYFQGWRDQVATKGAYLLTLANLGLTATSAWTTVTTDVTEVWLGVQQAFTVDISLATQAVVQTFNNSVTNFETNLKINLDRIVDRLTLNGYLDTVVQVNFTLGMLEDWDPYHMWMVMYTRYEEPGDDFYFYCYDCLYY